MEGFCAALEASFRWLGVRTRGGVEVTFRVGFCSRLVVMSSSRIHVCLPFRFGLAAVLRRLAALSSMD